MNKSFGKTCEQGIQEKRLSQHPFNEEKLLNDLKHYLPSQTPLKDFIHHNSLHAFQNLKFFEAIFTAEEIFGYQVTLQLSEFRELFATGRIREDVLDKVIADAKGVDDLREWKSRLLTQDYELSKNPRIGVLRSAWKSEYQTDLDNRVQPILFRILSSYLDQGISLWKFPVSVKGLLDAIRQLEKQSFSSFFRKKRARNLLLAGHENIPELLKILVGDERYYAQYLFDQQFAHRGWSGMVSALESAPNTLLDQRSISLKEFIFLELLLEIDALDAALGNNWKPLSTVYHEPPVNLIAPVSPTELQEVLTLWQQAFEWSYYAEVLNGIRQEKKKPAVIPVKKNFQAMFCIDERECSLRRHLEAVRPDGETFGTPGFFSVEFFFQPWNGKFYDKLCPAPVTPKYLIKETHDSAHRAHEFLYTSNTHRLGAGLLTSISLGFLAGARLIANIFRPKMSPAISNAFAHMHKGGKLSIQNSGPDQVENGLQIGFTVDEMTARVESLLRGIGLIKNFSPIIYVIAHGSSSANNPHHGAHDCGACSGRPGSVNARVFAFMANHKEVRNLLYTKGIQIPDDTTFIGGLHDTASDLIEFYEEELSEDQLQQHQKNKASFETALDRNAHERSRRFASINTRQPIASVRKAILDRSVSMFEPRPELGHGTNTLCIIGKRELTKSLFLDRRAFLNSYDHVTDPDGVLLTGIMRPIGPVCGGINLEYYFSRVDNYKLGAGTKLPHNVVGLIGVANSSDGDLRPGLPLQMIEVHDPVRLLIIVEHFPRVILKAIQSAPAMYEWYINEWVHLIAIHPEDGNFYYFRNGDFDLYEPMNSLIDSISNMKSFFESAKKMDTNNIVDATKENLPVHSIR